MGLCVETGEDNIPFIRLGSHQFRLDLEELPEEMKNRAAVEIRETPENVENGLIKFRELLIDEPNLRLPIDDDGFLIKFLRPCRFNPENALKILKKFYKFKVKYPKYSVNITPQSIRHVYENEVFEFLPTRTAQGGRILIINVGTKWVPKIVALEDMFRAIMVAIEIAMLEPKTQFGGVHVILDMSGLSLVHVAQFSPQMAKLILDWVQECTPVRLKGIHVINQPYIFNMLYAVFKPFLGEKIKKSLYFHGTNKKTLTEKIGLECLPESYGGTADMPHCPGSLIADILFYYEDDFKRFNTYGYQTNDETKA